MTRSTSTLTSFARVGLSACLAAGLALAPLPALAWAPPADGGVEAEPAPAEAEVGGNIAVLKFTGDPTVGDAWRTAIKNSFEADGYVANFIKRSIEEAAEKNKCRNIDDACLAKVAAYLNKNSKTAYDFFVYADLPAAGTGTIVIYDMAKGARVTTLEAAIVDGDYILPVVIAPAVAKRLVHYQAPPAGITEEEEAILAALDEPEKTPEEIQAEKDRIAQAEKDAVSGYNTSLDVGKQAVDLKADFKEFCREGKRKDKEIQDSDGTVSTERDLRPLCKRGPSLGYWQPRAWVALTLVVGSAATMGLMYGLAAASRSKWSSARDDLESSGLSGTDPNNNCDGDTCYADLAGQVSDAGAQIRRRAVIGDVMLGTTLLLGGVLAIIVSQDRAAAKKFISAEKELKAVSNLRLTPIFGQTNGAAIGFEF